MGITIGLCCGRACWPTVVTSPEVCGASSGSSVTTSGTPVRDAGPLGVERVDAGKAGTRTDT